MRLVLFAALISVSAASVSAASARVYEGRKTLLTGPYDENVAPENRPAAFSPVDYAAVFLENDYLRCCLLPGVGGRIYELYHKPTETQVFYARPYLETHEDGSVSSHEWNLGGLEVNFPGLGHVSTYHDAWQWAPIRDGDAAGVVMARTFRRTLQRVVIRILLRSGSARLDLRYRFENLGPFPSGLSGWINAAPAVGARSRWLLAPGRVARDGPGRASKSRYWPAPHGSEQSPRLETLSRDHGRPPPASATFVGVHDPATRRGVVRIYDASTLPVFKLTTRATGRPELRARIDSESSSLTDGVWRRSELSAREAEESWYPLWRIDGCVLATRDLALHVDRPLQGERAGRDIVLGVCASRKIARCVVSLLHEQEELYRTTLDLDPAAPWKKIVPAPPGPVLVEVLGPDGRCLARYELRDRRRPPRPEEPPVTGRADALEDARHGELRDALDGRPDRFLEESIRTYEALLARRPRDAGLMVDLARSYLRDAQLRVGSGGSAPTANFQKAHDLLQDVVKRNRKNSRARFYLGIALEALGKPANAAGEYRAALKGVLAAPASGLYLAHTMIGRSPAVAVEAARAAAGAYPQSRRARHMLMAALTEAGKPKEAVAIGRELYGLDPADPLTTHLLAESLEAAKEPGEAKRFESETSRLLGDDADARRGFDQDVRWLLGLDVNL